MAGAGDHLRASAQALLLVATSGMRARSLVICLPARSAARTHPGDVLVFLIPCVIDGALLLYFLRGFRAPVSSVAWAGAASAERPSPTSSGTRAGRSRRTSGDGVGRWVTTSAC